MKIHRVVACLVIVISLGLPARAGSILLDYSPDATGAVIEPAESVWSNIASGQNFAENISFNSNVLITGMDIYSLDAWGTVGAAVVVRTWNDLSGSPDFGSVNGFNSAISVMDTEGITTAPVAPYGSYARMHVDFGSNSFTLAANTTLWIGISGLQSEIGMLSLSGPNAPGNGEVYMFSGTYPAGVPTIGGMALRIHGENVPETSSVVLLLGLGLCGLVAVRRAIVR